MACCSTGEETEGKRRENSAFSPSWWFRL